MGKGKARLRDYSEFGRLPSLELVAQATGQLAWLSGSAQGKPCGGTVAGPLEAEDALDGKRKGIWAHLFVISGMRVGDEVCVCFNYYYCC